MDISDAVKYVGDNFVYKADNHPKIIGDTWQIMKKKEDNKFYGDCDDFAITCFWYYSDQSIIKFLLNLLITHKFKLYRCKTISGQYHVIGCVNDLYFDNWTRKALPKKQFFSNTKHRITMRYIGPIIAYFMFCGLLFDK